MLPELFIQQLKQSCDMERIVSGYLPLKKKGRYLVGLCPFHSEKSPSFYVYPQNQSFYCFGCGAGGDVITFIRRIENLEYMEAVKPGTDCSTTCAPRVFRTTICWKPMW